MITAKTLNPFKTYVIWQVGKGFWSLKIQDCSKKETNLPEKSIATHIAILINIGGIWFVIEAHAKWHGVKKLPFDEWIKDYEEDCVFCAECSLNMDIVQYFIDFNPGYSIAQIAKDAINEITDKHLWNDSPGVVCSELFANCEAGRKSCYQYHLPTYLIKPVHVQMEYMDRVIK